MSLSFTLNGREVTCQPDSVNVTLLQWLRREGLTGAKEGCAEGDCGACSVILTEPGADGQPVPRAINSCLVPLVLLAGRDIRTVEGVAAAPGRLHPVQESMVRHHGSQCGYCTPGFICALYEACHRPDLSGNRQLDEQLAGNLCRCTGYRAIHDAAVEALSARGGEGEARSSITYETRRTYAPPAAMACCSGHFLRPDSLSALFAAMAARPDARLIAGATELGLEITKRFHRFPALISLEAVPELRALRRTDGGWEIGAAVPLTDVADALGADYPIIARMLWIFGSRQIRNRATLGGNLVTASPIGDSAPVLLALDALVVLASAKGERTLPLTEFFVSYRQSALQPGEVLRSVIIPDTREHGPPAREFEDEGRGREILTRHADFTKVSRRREMDISTVSAAIVIDTDPAGVIRHARLAFGGVSALPQRATAVEEFLAGKPWNASTIESAATLLADTFTPRTDVRGSADFRRRVTADLLRKFYHDPTPPPAPDTLTAIAPFAEIPPPHESAHLHVTGAARYVDDLPPVQGELTVWLVTSPHAHARILRRDASAARAMPGIHAVLLAEDVPGLNDVGAVRHDEVLLAADEVHFHGHPVALVVGESTDQCRAAAAAVLVDYQPLPAVLTIDEAVAADHFHTDANTLRRGDPDAALAAAPRQLSGEFRLGGQEHFYLETQAALAVPGDDGSLFLHSSTQHPSEVQGVVAHVLGVPRHLITVESPRMGGGFGGKETQGNTPAALAALAASVTGRPVRVRFDRDRDMMLTGKRHPFLARFTAGFDDSGRLLALHSDIVSDGGWSLDLSMAICDRALFHHDNAYHIPALRVSGRVAKTHLPSNTAFRGFGGPQGMLIIEEILDRVARHCGLPPETVRERNLYHGSGDTNTTHYGQEIGDNRIPRIWQELLGTSAFQERRAALAAWNAASPHRKRGLAITPVKFGISFTLTHLNQAGALVLIYQDGSVQVNHGGTEMGQGLHTKIREIACRELGLSAAHVRLTPTRTDKVPNTSATAASSGTDLNGAAVRNACATLRGRLLPVAADLLAAAAGRAVAPDDVSLTENHAVLSGTGFRIPFAEVALRAWMNRVPLAASGFYATPDIGWDRAAGKGRPFYYFACGAAVSEVEVDGFTGMHQVTRVDILHDAGDSLNPGIDRGQIEGGFIQGMGWLTAEELLTDKDGRLLTHSPDTYKIPAIGDAPKDFRTAFLTHATQPGTVHGSKAVGEPPLMLAISVREALRDAIAAFAPGKRQEIPLPSPATTEAIHTAIWHLRHA